jgi:putative acetyltransferase
VNAQAFPRPALRPYLASDAALLIEIFRAAVMELAIEDYDEAQCVAWASCIDDAASFDARLTSNLTLVATLNGSAVGFISLKTPGVIDLLYVHPAAAREGVASALCEAIEKLAGARKLGSLETDASDTAKPFFERRGFVSQHRNTVEIAGEWLGNTHMKKSLEPNP